MSAHISTASYAWCNDCADGSEPGTRSEAEAWAAEHNKWNHSEESE